MKKRIKTSVALIIIGIFIIITGYGFSISNQSTISQETNRLKEIIEKAAVDCYALQGMYPKTFEELQEEYVLHINQIDYQIYYDYNGANIMPDIHVIRKE